MTKEQPNEAQGRAKGCRKVTLQERMKQQSKRAREAKTTVKGRGTGEARNDTQ